MLHNPAPLSRFHPVKGSLVEGKGGSMWPGFYLYGLYQFCFPQLSAHGNKR